jgi:hypothetical protein
MTSFVAHTTVDCRDACALSEWWKRFVEVPETKTTKNRLHLDLRPREGSRDDEVARVVALGAAEVADRSGIDGPGTGWVVLADPEGNEFCVLRSEAELALA